VFGTTPDPPAERLAYSVDEAAQIIGLSRDLLYDQMRTGQLAYLKVGRRRIITRQHLGAPSSPELHHERRERHHRSSGPMSHSSTSLQPVRARRHGLLPPDGRDGDGEPGQVLSGPDTVTWVPRARAARPAWFI
jgi:excisionase family DNA binding protein